MDTGSPRGNAKSDINVTPLIDVVLVLLIVFIVLVPGLTKALPVAVPKVVQTTTPPPADPRNPPVAVTLDAQGGLFLQQDRIELSQLAPALVAVVQLQPGGLRRVFGFQGRIMGDLAAADPPVGEPPVAEPPVGEP